MGNLLTIWEFIGKHKYLITILIFAAIIGFLDENISCRLRRKHKEAQRTKQ